MKTKISLVTLLLFFAMSLSFSQNTTESFVVETIGDGQPILYFPGFTVPGSVWKETVSNLDINGKSHLFSYAGFNGIVPINMPWYDTIKKDIFSYIQENKLDKIIIIGHSMGGNLAVDVAFQFPNLVSNLILVDSLPFMRNLMMPGVPEESLTYDNPYNQQMLNMDNTAREQMATMMATNMAKDKENQTKIKNWIMKADQKTWVYGYTDLLRLDLREKLKQITSKTLILGASFPDISVAKNTFEKQYANLKNKSIEMASNSKHFVMLDQPKWFYSTVNKFLSNGQ